MPIVRISIAAEKVSILIFSHTGESTMSDKLLTTADVSSLLNVSEVTVKRWAREHLIKSVKQGSDLVFPEEDVLKYKAIHDRLKR